MTNNPASHITRAPFGDYRSDEQEIDAAALFKRYHRHAQDVATLGSTVYTVNKKTLSSVHLDLPSNAQNSKEPPHGKPKSFLSGFFGNTDEAARQKRVNNEYDVMQSVMETNKAALLDAWKAKDILSILSRAGHIQVEGQAVSEMARRYQEKYNLSGDEMVWSGNAPPYKFGQKLSVILSSGDKAHREVVKVASSFGIPLISAVGTDNSANEDEPDMVRSHEAA